MSDPLERLRTSNQLLEASLKETASVIKLSVNHMRLALDGGADPTEVLLHCSHLLDGQRRTIATEIERIRKWSTQ